MRKPYKPTSAFRVSTGLSFDVEQNVIKLLHWQLRNDYFFYGAWFFFLHAVFNWRVCILKISYYKFSSDAQVVVFASGFPPTCQPDASKCYFLLSLRVTSHFDNA